MYEFIYFFNLQFETNTFVDFTRQNSTNNNNISNIKIKELEQEIFTEKNNNKKLSERIKELEELINKKRENNLTKKQNITQINQENLIIDKLTGKLKKLNNNININLNKYKINELLEELRIKDKIISNYPMKLLENEKLLSITFVSSDQKYIYSCICKNTDKFNIIENMLYEAYPEYMKSENYFFVNGNKINKYKSMDYNNIKNNEIIILQN